MKGQIRRGLLKSYVLKLLGNGEKSGYDIMHTIEQETGFWKPSAGSIYPLLQSLEEAGLIQHRSENRKKLYSLTDTGRRAAATVAEAGNEVEESINRSISVFNSVFGAEEPHHGRHKHLPDSLQWRWKRLHRAIHHIQNLDPHQTRSAESLMDELLQLLEASTSSQHNPESDENG